MRLTFAAFAMALAWPSVGLAQYPGLNCPGRWINYGGGQACLCPDGQSLADMDSYGRVVCPGRTVTNIGAQPPAPTQPGPVDSSEACKRFPQLC